MIGIKKPMTSTMTERRKFMIIYPSDSFKIGWDVFISIVLLSSCFTTPLNLAFTDIEQSYAWYRNMLWIMDGAFLFDIIINFNSACESETTTPIDNRKDIAKRYFEGWFFIDFISILPIDVIIKATGGQGPRTHVN